LKRALIGDNSGPGELNLAFETNRSPPGDTLESSFIRHLGPERLIVFYEPDRGGNLGFSKADVRPETALDLVRLTGISNAILLEFWTMDLHMLIERMGIEQKNCPQTMPFSHSAFSAIRFA